MNKRVELIAHPSSKSQDHQREEEIVVTISPLADQSSPKLRELEKASSDPETPLSSSEWPPSSPYKPPSDELPPDSSMESTEHRMSESGRDTKQSDHSSTRRRLSTTSVSSTPTRSTRKNPNRSSRALQSTARSSPSPVSVSADDKAKRFKCQEPGCDRAYAGASGLRYHMEASRTRSEYGFC